MWWGKEWVVDSCGGEEEEVGVGEGKGVEGGGQRCWLGVRMGKRVLDVGGRGCSEYNVGLRGVRTRW